MSRHAEWVSLPIIFGSMALALLVTDARSENRHHLDHHYERRHEELGKIWFPPLIEGRVQFFVPGQGLLYNSNTRRGKDCERRVGYDDGRSIVFEDCKEGATE